MSCNLSSCAGLQDLKEHSSIGVCTAPTIPSNMYARPHHAIGGQAYAAGHTVLLAARFSLCFQWIAPSLPHFAQRWHSPCCISSECNKTLTSPNHLLSFSGEHHDFHHHQRLVRHH